MTVSSSSLRPTMNAFALPSPGALAGIAGLGALALGGGSSNGSVFGSLARLALPAAGGYFGWTSGADFLRSTNIGQQAVGWISSTPVGGLLGADPYRPVGGALGALAGYLASRALF